MSSKNDRQRWRASRFMRPAEIEQLVGDSTKARKVLGWEPKVGFEELVQMMLDNDVHEQRALAGL